MDNKELGIFGENYATNYLSKLGYEIIKRNYRFSRNEVDIIAFFEGKYIFVEVKTRVTAVIGEPWRAVTKGKQRQIIKVAHNYLVENAIEEESRFDVVSIVHNSHGTFLEHIIDAFTS